MVFSFSEKKSVHGSVLLEEASSEKNIFSPKWISYWYLFGVRVSIAFAKYCIHDAEQLLSVSQGRFDR